MNEKLAKCLNDAADLIEKEGWTQGAFRTYDYNLGAPEEPKIVGRCMWGAIQDACPASAFDAAAAHLLLRFLMFGSVQGVFMFNDIGDREQKQVTDRLRAGAQNALAQ